MNKNPIGHTAAAETTVGAGIFEARDMLDEDGFFTQSDFEFGLDTLQDTSRAALQAYLSEAQAPGVDYDTVLFLKGYLMNSHDVNFTPFTD